MRPVQAIIQPLPKTADGPIGVVTTATQGNGVFPFPAPATTPIQVTMHHLGKTPSRLGVVANTGTQRVDIVVIPMTVAAMIPRNATLNLVITGLTDTDRVLLGAQRTNP